MESRARNYHLNKIWRQRTELKVLQNTETKHGKHCKTQQTAENIDNMDTETNISESQNFFGMTASKKTSVQK